MQPPHSMILSARNERPEGMFTPSAFAVSKIDDQLKVGRLLDRKSAGLVPLRTFPT